MDERELLFENLALESGFSSSRIEKYRNWVKNAKIARDKGLSDAKSNQYDKAEELITFYTFAPILLREDKNAVIEQILKLVGLDETLEGEVTLNFETQFQSPSGYLKWLQKTVVRHPVNYVRKQGIEHIKLGQRLEANTHVDVVIESDNLLILLEVKFTSDISHDVTFNPVRNQLARNIDVGIEQAKKKGKRLVVLLCTPKDLFQKKGRLYYYKIQEYDDFSNILEDIEWRSIESIKKYLVKVDWISLESVIEIVYQNLISTEKKAAEAFFEERNLLNK